MYVCFSVFLSVCIAVCPFVFLSVFLSVYLFLFYQWGPCGAKGNLYLTILTFTNYFYIGAPVMPLAVNIHERKFKSSHAMFWARVLCDIPALAKYRYVTNALPRNQY